MPVDGILKAELYGDLARLIIFAEPPERKTKNAGSAEEPALLSVVAGARNRLDLLLSASIVQASPKARSS
jgi:hypothetical protein